MKERYLRNIGALTAEEQARLYNKTVLIVGIGGLGGYDLMYMSRVGVGHIRFCDYDTFDESNLNRQLFSSEHNLGLNKVETTEKHIKYVNSAPEYISFNERFTEESASKMIKGCDVVIDALDNVESRLILEEACSKFKVPLVFGAVNGWLGNVSTVMPGKPKLANYYRDYVDAKDSSVLSFCVAAVSAYQSAEAVKVLLNKPMLEDKLLLIDLEDYETSVLPF